MASPDTTAALAGFEDIEPYSMHVSSRYLDLTKNKLELTRMPREANLTEQDRWGLGTPKDALEPLIDYWLESYDWRAQEAFFNTTLQQYRTLIRYPPLPTMKSMTADVDIDIEAAAATPPPEPEHLRVHFLHHRSTSASAIPLLYCHTWPGSFLEISRCLDALVSPVETPKQQAGGVWRESVAFHVVAPSLPGFGFSDASSRLDFGLKDTAGLLVDLMARLGYERFVVWGDSWGFKVARMLAVHHPKHVAAVYTSRVPDLPSPQVLKHKDAWVKYQIARLTGARFPWLSFGYTSSDFGSADLSIADEAGNGRGGAKPGDIELGDSLVVVDTSERAGNESNDRADDLVTRNTPEQALTAFPTSIFSKRPQTLAYGLCDSPAGLLALVLDTLRPKITHTVSIAPPKVVSRRRSNTVVQHGMPTIDETSRPQIGFTPADILNWTMMYWLPGPEASLRWLHNSEQEDCYAEYSPVPLGMSWFAQQVHSSARTSYLPAEVRAISSIERLRALSRSPHRKVDPPPVATPSSPPIAAASPMWASAIHDLKWVKRRSEPLDCCVTAWEKSMDVVRDVREFFEAGRDQGWLGL